MERSSSAPPRTPLPERFCNLERLLHAMQARNLDGIVATSMLNVFYLSGFNSIAHKSDEPRPYAVVLTRRSPEQPVMVIADYYLSTLLVQPTWIEEAARLTWESLSVSKPGRSERNWAISGSSFIRGF